MSWFRYLRDREIGPAKPPAHFQLFAVGNKMYFINLCGMCRQLQDSYMFAQHIITDKLPSKPVICILCRRKLGLTPCV